MTRASLIVVMLLLVLAGAGLPARAEGFRADRTAFFATCKAVPLYVYKTKEDEFDELLPSGRKTLSATAQANVEQIFKAWEKFGDGDKQKLAYVLATGFRESSYTFEPIREVPKCGDDEQCREVAIGKLLAAYAESKGREPSPNYSTVYANGQRYYGRGYVQLTHYKNYKKAEETFGVKVVDTPALALDPAVASQILVRGMLSGMFTGNKLGDYFKGTGSTTDENWWAARSM